MENKRDKSKSYKLGFIPILNKEVFNIQNIINFEALN